VSLAILGAVGSIHCRATPPASAPITEPATVTDEPAPLPVFAIVGAEVFDGERSLGPVTVVVRGDRIEAVGEGIAIPEGATIHDGAGHTLLPGLIDAHTHIWQRRHLEQALWFGVTTELDMMSAPAGLAVLKKRQRAGKDDDIADLRTAGFAVTAAGGHGTEYGLEVPTLAGPGDAAAFVEARVAEGSDYVKIIYDDMAIFGQTSPTISKATLGAAVEAAHALKKIAVVHVTTRAQAMDAIEAGADGLAHIWVDGAASAELLAKASESGVFVADTLAVLELLCRSGGSRAIAEDSILRPYLPPAQRRALSLVGQPQEDMSCGPAKEAVKALSAAGVPILASTDAPNPGTVHGASLHHDLELLVEAGLTPQAALTAATSAPAKAFSLDDRGMIAAGKRADLLLVRGAPTRDIKATRDIAHVWKRGVELDRAAIAEQVAAEVEVSEAARDAPPPPGSESGKISDFDDGEQTVAFGAGWIPSTDAMIGGHSEVELSVVKGGAERSKRSLEIRGTIDEAGLPRSWAGALFFPGAERMSPANLSGWRTLSFSARGDVQTMRVMLFSEKQGQMPSIRDVAIGAKWGKQELRFADFGVDPYDVTGIYFGLPASAGAAVIQIDEVRLSDPNEVP